METIEGYEVQKQTMKDIIYVRMHDDMIKQLRKIRKITGIPVSEVIRESVRKTLIEVEETGSMNFKIR